MLFHLIVKVYFCLLLLRIQAAAANYLAVGTGNCVDGSNRIFSQIIFSGAIYGSASVCYNVCYNNGVAGNSALGFVVVTSTSCACVYTSGTTLSPTFGGTASVNSGVAPIAASSGSTGTCYVKITPTPSPSASPTSPRPSAVPTFRPSFVPTIEPSATPTTAPSPEPTIAPTSGTDAPTVIPSYLPSELPTENPTNAPTAVPSFVPTATPTAVPSDSPSALPTISPTAIPTHSPTNQPTAIPTTNPTAIPTEAPTAAPSAIPTISPSSSPTTSPTPSPTSSPTFSPTAAPTAQPTATPTAAPTTEPTESPTTSRPSFSPSARPTAVPSLQPSLIPTAPTFKPTATPSFSPTALNRDVVKVSATSRVKSVDGTTLNEVSLATLIEAFRNISGNPQSTTITSTVLVSGPEASGSVRGSRGRESAMVSSAEVVRGWSVFDVSFLNSYVMAYHVGYNSSELAAMKVSKIQQEIALGSFETTLRTFALASNAVQLLNGTCNELTSIEVTVKSGSSDSSSSSSVSFSIGAIAGIIVGVIAAIILVVLLIFAILRLRKGNNKVYIAAKDLR